MSRNKKVKVLAYEDWGEALHTALRKACDSTPTSIAYCAVSDLSLGWRSYLRYLAESKTEANAADLKAKSLKWDYYKDVPRQEINLSIILKCAFELFEDTDWDGYASFLTYGDSQ